MASLFGDDILKVFENLVTAIKAKHALQINDKKSPCYDLRVSDRLDFRKDTAMLPTTIASQPPAVQHELISFSMLQAFWCCPRLYHYRYLERLPGLSSDSLSSQVGRRIHEQLHHDFLGLKTPLSTEPEQAPLWQKYQAAIAPYQAWQGRSEWSGHLPFAAGEQTIWLVAQIDRLYFDSERLLILDWKTGQSGKSRQSGLAQLQMQFYAWLLWQHKAHFADSIQQIETQLHYLNGDLNSEEPVISQCYDASRIADLDTQFNELIQNFLGSSHPEVPAPRSVQGDLWCKMCEYNRLCPEGRNHA